MPNRRIPLNERFWSKVQKTDTCWIWIGGMGSLGYGSFSLNHQVGGPAHRFAYQYLVGPIPAGLHLDHLCRNRACVNPAHLEPVTPRENTLRGIGVTAVNARKTHCIHGHEFTPENTAIFIDKKGNKHRGCKTCKYEHAKANKVYKPMTPEQKEAHMKEIGRLSGVARRAKYANMTKPVCDREGCDGIAEAYKGGPCWNCYQRERRAKRRAQQRAA